MSDDDEKLAFIQSALASAKPPRKPRVKKTPAVSVNISGNHGDGNGIGNTIIKTERVVTRTVAKPNPGREHITEEQVARLHALKDEILRLEQAVKRDPATPWRVWGALCKKMRVGSMRMIPIEKFPAAEKFLRTWIARLMDQPSAIKKAADTVRKRRISFIHTNMNKLGCENRVRDYMQKHFGVRSLTDLPDAAALERVYRYVAGLKKASVAS